MPNYITTGTENQWQQVLESDESKFEIYVSNHHQYVQRSRERYNCESVKYAGGSVILRSCMSASSVRDLVKIVSSI